MASVRGLMPARTHPVLSPGAGTSIVRARGLALARRGAARAHRRRRCGRERAVSGWNEKCLNLGWRRLRRISAGTRDPAPAHFCEPRQPTRCSVLRWSGLPPKPVSLAFARVYDLRPPATCNRQALSTHCSYRRAPPSCLFTVALCHWQIGGFGRLGRLGRPVSQAAGRAALHLGLWVCKPYASLGPCYDRLSSLFDARGSGMPQTPNFWKVLD